MPAKIITLSQKDQDLLRAALTRAQHSLLAPDDSVSREQKEVTMIARIKDLKDRLLV